MNIRTRISFSLRKKKTPRFKHCYPFQATINETTLPADNIQYDDVSGKVTSFGGYSVLYLRMNVYIISSRDVMYTKERDFSGRLVKIKLEIYRLAIFWQNKRGHLVVSEGLSNDAAPRVATEYLLQSMAFVT